MIYGIMQETRMRKILFNLFLLFLLFRYSAANGYAESFNLEKAKAVFSSGIEHIADCIRYPLQREYPLLPIRNKKEFLMCSNSIIDEVLLQKISNSTREDWFTGSWRGYGYSGIWLDFDYTIIAVNYETTAYAKEFATAVQRDKLTVPEAYRNFLVPVKKWIRNGKIYRIDKTDAFHYRLLILNEKTEKQYIAVYKGSCHPDGTGGNHFYVWDDGTTIHFVYVGDFCGNSFYSAIEAENFDIDTVEQYMTELLEDEK